MIHDGLQISSIFGPINRRTPSSENNIMGYEAALSLLKIPGLEDIMKDVGLDGLSLQENGIRFSALSETGDMGMNVYGICGKSFTLKRLTVQISVTRSYLRSVESENSPQTSLFNSASNSQNSGADNESGAFMSAGAESVRISIMVRKTTVKVSYGSLMDMGIGVDGECRKSMLESIFSMYRIALAEWLSDIMTGDENTDSGNNPLDQAKVFQSDQALPFSTGQISSFNSSSPAGYDCPVLDLYNPLFFGANPAFNQDSENSESNLKRFQSLILENPLFQKANDQLFSYVSSFNYYCRFAFSKASGADNGILSPFDSIFAGDSDKKKSIFETTPDSPLSMPQSLMEIGLNLKWDTNEAMPGFLANHGGSLTPFLSL